MRWLRLPLVAILSVSVLTAQSPSRLANLSVLTELGAGSDGSFTVGFVTNGTGNDGFPILARAVGPELAQTFGIGDAVGDPRIELFAGARRVAQNDNWGAVNPTMIAAASANVGAFPLTSAASKDAAMALVMQGANSLVVSAAAGNTGRVLAEVYDRRPLGVITQDAAQLVNMSVLKQVDRSLTVGFVIDGSAPKPVLIRAIGASLTDFGVQNAMRDPKLELLGPDQARLMQNDNWSEGAAAENELRATFRALGAFDLQSGSSDAAISVTLAPGPYTVGVTAASGAGGNVLVEVYDATRAGLTVSKAAAVPGEVLALSGQFDASLPLEATFTTRSGRSFSTPVRRTSGGQLEITMPLLLDGTGTQFSTEPVDLTVHAVTQTGRKVVGSVARLTATELPSTGVPAGAVVGSFIGAATSVSARAIANFQEIERLTGLSTSEFRAAITEETRRASALHAHVADVLAGRKTSFVLGGYQGQPMVVDREALGLLDQLTASYIRNVNHQAGDGSIRADQLVERRLSEFDLARPDTQLRVARNATELGRALSAVFSPPSGAQASGRASASEPPRAALAPAAAYALYALGTLMVGYGANLATYDVLGQTVEGDFTRETGAPAALATDPSLTGPADLPPGVQLDFELSGKSTLRGLLQKFDPILTALRLRTRPIVVLEPRLAEKWPYGQPPPAYAYTAIPMSEALAHLSSDDLKRDISGSPIVSTDATRRSQVGEYRLAMAAGSLSSSKYKLRLRESALTIEPAPLLVTAQRQVRLQNTDNGPFVASYVGFAEGDNADNALQGSLEFATSATRESPIGSYPITIQRNTLFAPNYQLTFTNGLLTIAANLREAFEAACEGAWRVRHVPSGEEYNLLILPRNPNQPDGIGYYYDLPLYHGVRAPYDANLRRYRIRWTVSPIQENQYIFQDFDFHNAGYNQSNVVYRAPLTLPNNRMIVYASDRTTPLLEYTRQ